MDLYIACGAESQRRKHDFRPEPQPHEPKHQDRCEWKIAMRAKLRTEEGRKRYAVRNHTVEPVFGIIKDVLGFRRFTLRGLSNVCGEWQLVALAYNFKRLHVLRRADRTPGNGSKSLSTTNCMNTNRSFIAHFMSHLRRLRINTLEI